MNRGRPRTAFVCQECGAQALRWEGRCPQCSQWNTLVNVQTPSRDKRGTGLGIGTTEVQELATVSTDKYGRIRTSLQELDRVLGGGIVPGALVLLGGDPGIGKSTLLLQTSALLTGQGHSVLYVSGEESVQQVKLRAQRLGIYGKDLFFLGETEIEVILAKMDALRPFLVVVDSVQTLSCQDVASAAGSIAQVRECTRQLMQWSKVRGVPIFLAGHVTKDGSVAGPRALEHMVDVVLYLEGDTLSPYRILRGAKNRFGSTNEIGVFQMGSQGLQDVKEPSLLFLSSQRQTTPGSVVLVTMEGSRPLLAEVQALTTPTVFTQPRRVATGIDFHRLLLVAAVVSKRLGIPLGDQDIIVNIAGGLHVEEPAADLSIALSIVSSVRNIPCDYSTVVIGEVGLGGELRGVAQLGRRLSEAARLGFKRAMVPEIQIEDALGSDLEIMPMATIADAVRSLFPRRRRQSNTTLDDPSSKAVRYSGGAEATLEKTSVAQENPDGFLEGLE